MNPILKTAIALGFLLAPLLQSMHKVPINLAKVWRGFEVALDRSVSRRRVLAVTGVPGDSKTFYFGGVAGGVWRTTNTGFELDATV